jgi:hypothetical protein
MPAINFAGLLQGAGRSLVGYRQGQREEEDRQREIARQNHLDMFSEWARQRALQLQEEGLQQQGSLREAMLKHQKELQDERLKFQGEIATARNEAAEARAKLNLGNRPIQIDNQGRPFVLDATTNSMRPIEGDARFPIPGANQGRQQQPRRLPVGEVEKIAGVNAMIDMANSAKQRLTALMEKGVNASGPVAGRLSMFAEAVGRVPKDVIDLRATLANIGSREMLERSGAAVTPQEFERLRPYLPSKNDREQDLVTKLDGFIREVKLIQEHRMGGLEDAEYDMSNFRAREAGRGGAPDEDPDLAALRALRARKKP